MSHIWSPYMCQFLYDWEINLMEVDGNFMEHYGISWNPHGIAWNPHGTLCKPHGTFYKPYRSFVEHYGNFKVHYVIPMEPSWKLIEPWWIFMEFLFGYLKLDTVMRKCWLLVALCKYEICDILKTSLLTNQTKHGNSTNTFIITKISFFS